MAKGSDERATIGRTVYDGHTLPITLASGEVIEIDAHGGRQRWQIRVPAGVVVGTPEFRDARNQDDQGDR